MQQFFKWTFLPAELERGTKALQFDVCREAIDQSFDCAWLHSQKMFCKFALIQIQAKKITLQKIWNNWLKEQP